MNFRRFSIHISIILSCFLIGNAYGQPTAKFDPWGLFQAQNRQSQQLTAPSSFDWASWRPFFAPITFGALYATFFARYYYKKAQRQAVRQNTAISALPNINLPQIPGTAQVSSSFNNTLLKNIANLEEHYDPFTKWHYKKSQKEQEEGEARIYINESSKKWCSERESKKQEEQKNAAEGLARRTAAPKPSNAAEAPLPVQIPAAPPSLNAQEPSQATVPLPPSDQIPAASPGIQITLKPIPDIQNTDEQSKKSHGEEQEHKRSDYLIQAPPSQEDPLLTIQPSHTSNTLITDPQHTSASDPLLTILNNPQSTAPTTLALAPDPNNSILSPEEPTPQVPPMNYFQEPSETDPKIAYQLENQRKREAGVTSTDSTIKKFQKALATCEQHQEEDRLKVKRNVFGSNEVHAEYKLLKDINTKAEKDIAEKYTKLSADNKTLWERVLKGRRILNDLKEGKATELPTAENIQATVAYLYTLGLQIQGHCLEEMTFQIANNAEGNRYLNWLNRCKLVPEEKGGEKDGEKYLRTTSHFQERAKGKHYGVDGQSSHDKRHSTWMALRKPNFDEDEKEYLSTKEIVSFFIKPEKYGVRSLYDIAQHGGDWGVAQVRKSPSARATWNASIDTEVFLGMIDKAAAKKKYLYSDDHITYRKEQVPEYLKYELFPAIVKEAEKILVPEGGEKNEFAPELERKAIAEIQYKAGKYGICYMVAKMKEYRWTKPNNTIVQTNCKLLLNHIYQRYGSKYLDIRKGNEFIFDFSMPLTKAGQKIVPKQLPLPRRISQEQISQLLVS